MWTPLFIQVPLWSPSFISAVCTFHPNSFMVYNLLPSSFDVSRLLSKHVTRYFLLLLLPFITTLLLSASWTLDLITITFFFSCSLRKNKACVCTYPWHGNPHSSSFCSSFQSDVLGSNIHTLFTSWGFWGLLHNWQLLYLCLIFPKIQYITAFYVMWFCTIDILGLFQRLSFNFFF